LRIFVLKTVFTRVLAENFASPGFIGRKSIKIINILKLGRVGMGALDENERREAH
jgi:hypothetical protein